MRVVVTRPEPEAGVWTAWLRDRGVDAVALPLIRIVPADDRAPLVAAWQQLGACRAAMFVSGNAVRHFFAVAGGPAWPPRVRAWATGPGTAQALADAGVPADQVDVPAHASAQFDSETLWSMTSHQVQAADRVLIVRGAQEDGAREHGRDWLAQQLRSRGAAVDTVIAYARGLPQWSAAQAQRARALAEGATWLFSSSQAIAHLTQLLPGQSWARTRAVATHPRIAQAAHAAGFAPVQVSRPALDDLAATLKSAA